MQPGSVAEYLSDFAAHLTAQGYRSLSVSNYLWPALHFGEWIDANRIALTDVTNETLTGFRDHYCECPGHRKLKHVSQPYIARTRYFLEYLRGRNVINAESAPAETLPGCIVDFSDWLLQHRGSAPATIKQYQRTLRRILKVLGDDPLTYDAANVRQGAIASTSGCGRPLAKRIITTFRMYLRYLSTIGKVRPCLDRVLPTVPQWKLSSLPRHMEPKFVPWLIASCDTDQSKGMRDRAVLLCSRRLVDITPTL
jgi:integrase/recombinase XerD